MSVLVMRVRDVKEYGNGSANQDPTSGMCLSDDTLFDPNAARVVRLSPSTAIDGCPTCGYPRSMSGPIVAQGQATSMRHLFPQYGDPVPRRTGCLRSPPCRIRE